MIELPELPYLYGSLEPVLSAETLRTHHGRHHARYVEVVNSLTAGASTPETLEDLIRRAALAGDRKLFNNAAQAWNHGFFWDCMTPQSRAPRGALAAAIDAAFGDRAALRETFIAEGASHFGSGWIWLAAEDDRLLVFSTHDADTVVTRDLTPLLVCDVWEHAYYLDHRSDRGAFLAAWWDRLANWAFAEAQFAAATEGAAAWRYPVAMDLDGLAIRDHSTLEQALEEAFALLDGPPAPSSFQERRLSALLQGIDRYRDEATKGRARSPLPADLDRRIRAAALRAAQRSGGDSPHWSPLLGGDLGHPTDAGGRQG